MPIDQHTRYIAGAKVAEILRKSFGSQAADDFLDVADKCVSEVAAAIDARCTCTGEASVLYCPAHGR